LLASRFAFFFFAFILLCFVAYILLSLSNLLLLAEDYTKEVRSIRDFYGDKWLPFLSGFLEAEAERPMPPPSPSPRAKRRSSGGKKQMTQSDAEKVCGSSCSFCSSCSSCSSCS
jgi:hypothetical protein